MDVKTKNLAESCFKQLFIECFMKIYIRFLKKDLQQKGTLVLKVHSWKKQYFVQFYVVKCHRSF